jgi:hypothetical protein
MVNRKCWVAALFQMILMQKFFIELREVKKEHETKFEEVWKCIFSIVLLLILLQTAACAADNSISELSEADIESTSKPRCERGVSETPLL